MKTLEKVLWLIAAVLVGAIACSSRSLWIDEFSTLEVAGKVTFGEFLSALKGNPFSESQMPLYLGYLWAWIRCFGDSEYSLHLANAPWLVAAVAACIYWIRNKGAARWAICLFLVSPFFWYYLDEARPYAMQAGGSALMLGIVWPVFAANRDEKFTITGGQAFVFMLGALVCCSSSMLGVPWFLGVLSLLVVGVLRKQISLSLSRGYSIAIGFVFVILGILAIYYVGTILRGASPALKHQSLILEFGFASYELFGFSGLGPTRFNLRDVGLSAFKPQHVGIALLVLAYCTALWHALRGGKLKLGRHNISLTVLLLSIPIGFLVIVSITKGFRVVGRHLSPALPLVVFGITAVVIYISATAKRRYIVGGIILLAWACSALLLRFSPPHGDDDYQSAAAAAIRYASEDKQVWWVANAPGFQYYARKTDISTLPIDIFKFEDSSSSEVVLAKVEPDIVLISKPDIFDQKNIVSKRLEAQGFTGSNFSRAFDLWTKKSNFSEKDIDQ